MSKSRDEVTFLRVIFNKFSIFFIFFSAFFLAACGVEEDVQVPVDEGVEKTGSDQDEVQKVEVNAVRSLADKGEFPYVGIVTYKGAIRCSGMILKHGVFATAKHCFKSETTTALELLKYSLGFTLDGIVDESPTDVIVKGAELRELRFDGEGNDIAYFIYVASATEGKVTIPDFSHLEEVPTVGADLALVGFPSYSDKVKRKIMTLGCQRLDREGVLESPLPKDPVVYDGKVFDTDCGAWFGNSGGPVFSGTLEGSAKFTPNGVAGVVTHTFDVDEEGVILKSAMAEDAFGAFVATVNFSPFTQATQDGLIAVTN